MCVSCRFHFAFELIWLLAVFNFLVMFSCCICCHQQVYLPHCNVTGYIVLVYERGLEHSDCVKPHPLVY